MSYYFGWVNCKYRLVLCIGSYRPTIPWRRPSYIQLPKQEEDA